MIVNQEHILKIRSQKNTHEVVFLLIGSSLFAGGAIVFLFMGPAQERNEYFRRSEGRAKRGPELLVYTYIYTRTPGSGSQGPTTSPHSGPGPRGEF